MSESVTPVDSYKRKIQGYGFIPSLPDQRDKRLSLGAVHLPPSVDLRDHCPPVVDQLALGSCTANAIAGAIGYVETVAQEFVPLSRLFIYYNERVMEGTVSSDSGAMLRDGIKSVAKVGACPETDWPYYIAQFNHQPIPLCYTDAAAHKAIKYLAVAPSQMKACLASGFPFVFGFSVYESFESSEVARTGIAPMPKHGESLLGGHAVMAVGYDDSKGSFLIRNSWGTGWGQAGYFTLPYAYLNGRLSTDRWSIQKAS